MTILFSVAMLYGCTASIVEPPSVMRTQVLYTGQVQGGGQASDPFTLSMAGARTVILTGSTVDISAYRGKEVEVTGTIPGLTQRMWVEVTVEGMRELR